MTDSLLILMPAYDEEENLERLLPEILQVCNDNSIPVRIVVIVKLAASDASIGKIERLGAASLRRAPTDSFGDAIRSGITQIATLDTHVLLMDADGSHSPHSIPNLWRERGRANVIVASRYVKGGSTADPGSLRFMSRLLNFTYGQILRIPCRDISTNYKLYRAQELNQLILTSSNFDVVEEILLRLKVNGGGKFEILELPDHFMKREFGVTKRKLGPFVVSYIYTLARLRVSTWRGN